MTRGEALRDATERLRAAGCPEPVADAEVLLADLLEIERPRLRLDRRTALGSRVRAAYARRIARRIRREPVAYITGEREFWSLPIRVTRAVLIPRPETETLVQVGLELLEKAGFHGGAPDAGRRRALRVIDVGTGSGCVAIALASANPRVRVQALDRSARALAVASKNVARHGLGARVKTHRADLLEPLGGKAGERRRIAPAHLIVSNPPYVAGNEWRALAPEIRDWEPAGALAGGEDGLKLHRRLAAGAAAHLLPGGWIAVEVGAGQAGAVARLYEGRGPYEAVQVFPDLAGIPRVVAARKAE